MNPKLAQELKDAGFPHVRQSGAVIHLPSDNGIEWWSPTLEELIEECGDVGIFTFADKTQGANAWTKHADPDEFPIYHGATPIEAVARLWLAWNQKA